MHSFIKNSVRIVRIGQLLTSVKRPNPSESVRFSLFGRPNLSVRVVRKRPNPSEKTPADRPNPSGSPLGDRNSDAEAFGRFGSDVSTERCVKQKLKETA